MARLSNLKMIDWKDSSFCLTGLITIYCATVVITQAPAYKPPIPIALSLKSLPAELYLKQKHMVLELCLTLKAAFAL